MSATVTLPLSEYEALKRKLDGQKVTIKILKDKVKQLENK